MKNRNRTLLLILFIVLLAGIGYGSWTYSTSGYNIYLYEGATPQFNLTKQNIIDMGFNLNLGWVNDSNTINTTLKVVATESEIGGLKRNRTGTYNESGFPYILYS